MKVDFRNLTAQEVETISDEIKNTKNITGYTPAELLKLGNMLVAIEDKTITGVLYYKEHQKFIDLKIMIVIAKWRGRGIGRELFQKFIAKAKKNKKIYTITKSPEVIALISKAGFKNVGWFGLPVLAQLNEIAKGFSLYRIKEAFRKGMLNDKNKFSHWVRN